MTLIGLSLAARISAHSEYELLAQAVDDVLPVYRDASGGFYFDPADLADVPPRTTCVVKGCGRNRRKGSWICSSHYRRLRAGKDLMERIQVEKAQRGASRKDRTGQRMHLMRPEESRYDAIGGGYEPRKGSVTTASIEARENAAAEQLGTPEMWREVADRALEQAWQDLASGAYERRLTARLAALASPKARAVQSPLIGIVRGIR